MAARRALSAAPSALGRAARAARESLRAHLAGVRRRARLRGAGWTLLGLALAWAGAEIVLRELSLPARLAQPHSTLVTFADGSPAHVFLSPDDKYRIGARLEEIDPDYVTALLRFEDKRFRDHGGVDPAAVLRAAALNVRHGEVRSGASTLTMQLARILEPRPRTLRSKALEALRALQLERQLDKDEILAAFLTFAPYGRNVEGLQAASLAYFGHGAAALSPAEIATLLAVPQSPARRFPAEGNGARLAEARDRIAEWLLGHGALPLGEGAARVDSEHVLREIRRERVPAKLRPLPRDVPHAAAWLAQRHPGASRLATTLDRGVQRVAEEKLRRAREEMASRGIFNASVVVVDHRSAEVKALVGNFDFWDDRHAGQIAGFAAPRSPGSALKPFLFAMAIDRGLALPEQLVADVPTRYGSYAPENYDGAHAGLVRLDEALAWSLNVPFVDLLSSLGVERFLGALQEAGATSVPPDPGRHGLSAAIGSLEVTPLDVASLYGTLARSGRHQPLRMLRDDDVVEPRRVFSPGAAWLTRRALSRRDRPDFPLRRQLGAVRTGIHWKTGTSYGHRDAWAAGSGARYTAVAWLGNFDNAPSVDLVGAEAAAPILFDLLEALEPASRVPVHDGPTGDLRVISACATSGFVAAPSCPERQASWAVREHVPITTCPYHVAVDVDVETGLALNPSCRAGRTWETRTFLAWPPAVRRWLGDHRVQLPAPPSLDPRCEVSAARPPRILSPPSGQVLLLASGLPRDAQQVPLEADGTAGSARHAWFVDGEYLGTTSADDRAWWTPQPGVHRLVVVDETGAASSQRLEVRAGQ